MSAKGHLCTGAFLRIEVLRPAMLTFLPAEFILTNFSLCLFLQCLLKNILSKFRVFYINACHTAR